MATEQKPNPRGCCLLMLNTLKIKESPTHPYAFMATMCSCSNHSPTLPTISLHSVLPLKSSFHTSQNLQPPPQPLSSSSFAKLSLSSVSEDTATITAAVEAVALANAAVEAARDAVFSASVLVEFSNDGENGCQYEIDGLSEIPDWRHTVRTQNRKRRRKRKKISKFLDTGSHGEKEQCSFRHSRSLSLTSREEAEFSSHLREGARLEAARRRIGERGEGEPSSSQWARAVGMERRDLDKMLCRERESRERIILSYRRLISYIANNYKGKGLSLQDLIQEGSIGLLRGAERFDPEKGYKLSTYVYWWIKQAIIKAIANKSRVIRLPGSMSEKLAKIAEANNVLSTRLRRLPTYDEIADMVNISVSSVRLIWERNRPPISAQRTLANQGSLTLQEIISGPEETRAEVMVSKQLMKQDLEKLLRTLDKREACVLGLYFGLNGETPRSCEEIGRLLKLSRERVRQINGIALTKLRQMSTIDSLRVYMK
ncbi:RNA polymerase sigma factor sigD, chloroplastic isoform X2 [Macadamia integrifolia]|uniref:RNA polymerase sigma factor sigD, chloroplastic isoform X2 n=1 Tax=Macadamia integrifolia TaxID=60698 RepID=UPI001C4F28E2|nr:RNA polymerase sigma factor sigD, chloroplastic isoform X2 [Macadamia integrifolia]